MGFDHIYQDCFSDVFHYLCGLTGDHHLAEELTQETFFKALKALDQYDGRKDIRAWLFTIGRNTFYSHCRKRGRAVSWEELRETPSEVSISWTGSRRFSSINFCIPWPSPTKRSSPCGSFESCPMTASPPSLARPPAGPE